MSGPGGYGPAAGGPGFNPAPRRSAGLAVSVAAAVVAILSVVGVGVWNFLLSPVEAAPGSTPIPSAVVTTASPSSDPPPTADPPPTFEPPPTIEPSSAEEVRLAYGQQPVRERAVVVDAYSQVTGVTYTLTCQPGRLVTCTGGNNAVVHLI